MKKGDELILDVIELNSEGKGVSKTEEGFVIFTDKVLPGDKVKIQLRKKKSNYGEAKLLEVITPSAYRIVPPCPYFGTCGGCKIQNYVYEKQLEFKTEAVRNAFKRIGGFENLEIPPALPSENIFYYRNKMEFSFSDDRWLMAEDIDKDVREENEFALGLHVPKFHSKIIDIKECFLQSEVSNKVLNYTRDFFKSREISIYTTETHSGFLRFLIIRECKNTPDFMVSLITYDYNEPLINEYAEGMKKIAPEVTTFINAISSKKAQVAFGEEEKIIFGKGYIEEELNKSNGLKYKFKISANSFFQTNTKQGERLYDIAARAGDFKKTDRVLDLYCGTGSISIFISDEVAEVKGVELVEDSIKNAFQNKELNNIANVDFELGDIKDFLLSNDVRELHKYNKVILDPPRAGLHPKICEILSESDFEKIVYVSCNPVTQARDLQIICSQGKYKINSVQPVDMFPHTYHIENVVDLIKVKSHQ
jgi:23S rRNA (uracil1939-C5)-methyltransferase